MQIENSLSCVYPTHHHLEVLAKSTSQVAFAYQIADHQFSFLNPAFEKIWCRTRKSVMTKPASLLKSLHPEDKAHVLSHLNDLIEGALIPELEFRIQLRNGSERWLCVKPLLLEDEQVIIGFAEDITASKEYNSYLKRFSDKKNAILNILSHDLAGPLAMIQSLTHRLGEDLNLQDNPEVHYMITQIEKSSRQGTQMIQEFMKLEFLESANVDVIKRRVNLVGALKESMEEYQQQQQLTNKNFRFQTSTESIFLELDDNKFMQVINNLISNAIKFTPDGGEISVTVEEQEATILIKVADTGIGIPGKFHATLFEKFTKARRPGIKGEPSVGLGMSIIKTIVEWHQGHIWFVSQENKGTTFYIELPKPIPSWLT